MPAPEKPAAKKAGIGVKRESSLHRSLKFRYAASGDLTEKEIGEFICDGIGKNGELIEVQTGSFAPLKKKIPAFTARFRVRIIHPIILTKYIELYDEAGSLVRRRKSPRSGTVWDLFGSLLYAPELPLLPGLSVELALVDITEKRVADGKGSWRRKGASIRDRELLAWHEAISLEKPRDYRRFAPFRKGEEFTVRDLADKARIDTASARKTLYVLHKMKLLKRKGKRGNSFVYVIGN
ncbi:MAG: hypothetical protein LBB83_06825 [Treponema sp.]|nr:hypothetical protein [Treponema sp.]